MRLEEPHLYPAVLRVVATVVKPRQRLGGSKAAGVDQVVDTQAPSEGCT